MKDTLEPIDIEKKYLTFPSTIQAEILDIYNFITGSMLSNRFIELSQAVKDIKDIVENASIAVDKYRFRWSVEHKNLNDFVLLNHILIEDNVLFRKIQQMYIEIAVLRKSTQKNIVLNRNELFSCIHYFDYPQNNHSLNKLFDENSVGLKFELEDEDWLVNIVLPNCIKIYRQNGVFNSRPYLFNVLCIFSYAHLSEESMMVVFSSIEEILGKCTCNGYILKQIYHFFCLQYDKNELAFKNRKFLLLFISVIDKYLKGHVGAEEQMAFCSIASNDYEIIYKIALVNQEIFEDVDRLQGLINAFEAIQFDEKIACYIKILMPLYVLDNEDVKKYLKKIFLDFANKMLNEPVRDQFRNMLSLKQIEYYKYWYELKLIEIGLKLPESDYIQTLETWLTNINNQKGTSSLDILICQMIRLLKTKHPEFGNAWSICKEIIQKHESMRFLQI